MENNNNKLLNSEFLQLLLCLPPESPPLLPLPPPPDPLHDQHLLLRPVVVQLYPRHHVLALILHHILSN